jgi:hypothetical protein
LEFESSHASWRNHGLWHARGLEEEFKEYPCVGIIFQQDGGRSLIPYGRPGHIQKAECDMCHSKTHYSGPHLAAYRFAYTGNDQTEPGNRQACGCAPAEHALAFKHLESLLFDYSFFECGRICA